MTNFHINSHCGQCPLSRRTFLAAGCATCAGIAGGTLNIARADNSNKGNAMKVRVIFVMNEPVLTGPSWPNVGFNFAPVIEETMKALNDRCQGIDFIASAAGTSEQIQKIIKEDAAAGNIDGYLMMQTQTLLRLLDSIIKTGKPVLYTELIYGGGGAYLGQTAHAIRSGAPNFAFITGGKLDYLVAAAQCFTIAKDGNAEAFSQAVTKLRIDRTPNIIPAVKEDPLDLLTTDELLKELKGKKIILCGKPRAAFEAPLQETFGIETINVAFAELNDFWKDADNAQALEIVKQWKNGAFDVIGVTDETLEASAKMYLAQKACLKKHGACAITIHCLGGFYGGHIQAYPCLGFHQLLNEGLVGACEGDLRSTLTMVIMSTLTKGRPGFISDPVMDHSTRQIIFAHCVASNKAFGPAGQANPFTIMTHSEDRKGASVRSTLPVGYMTTTLEIAPEKKQILFHQGVSVDNITDDRACRTKIATVPVGDYEKLYTMWPDWGWHRVTYYGDLR